MGGIRNREEKKKAAKVFSSGGGGGTKGPSIIDKRNQEQKCPYCDRVFKQVSEDLEQLWGQGRNHPFLRSIDGLTNKRR